MSNRRPQNLKKAEAEHREYLIAANAAFIQRMNRAIARGKEHASFGTYTCDKPWHEAKRFYGSENISTCGSPAALCAT